MTHQFRETEWFSVTTTPVRSGWYKTRHRGSDGKVYEGYSYWNINKWGTTHPLPKKIIRVEFPSPQQSREWKGIYNDD